MWQFWYSSGPFYSDSLPFRELTGKVYEGVPLPSPCKNTTLREVNEVVYGISLREWKMLHEIGVWWAICCRVATPYPAYNPKESNRPVQAKCCRAQGYLSKVPQFSTQGLDSLSGSGCSLASISSISPTRWALCSCNSASNCLPPLQKLT